MNGAFVKNDPPISYLQFDNIKLWENDCWCSINNAKSKLWSNEMRRNSLWVYIYIFLFISLFTVHTHLLVTKELIGKLGYHSQRVSVSWLNNHYWDRFWGFLLTADHSEFLKMRTPKSDENNGKFIYLQFNGNKATLSTDWGCVLWLYVPEKKVVLECKSLYQLGEKELSHSGKCINLFC